MPAFDPAASMFELITRQQELDMLADSITGQTGSLFGPERVRLPVFDSPQLGFISVSSWLYVRYFETGRIGVRYLVGKTAAYVSARREFAHNHTDIVRGIRTYFQHPLDPNAGSDSGLGKRLLDWWFAACNTRAPRSEEHWDACLRHLMIDAAEFLNVCDECLRAIENDEAARNVVNDWSWRLTHHVEPGDVDVLIRQVSNDLGRSGLIASKVRQKYYEQWMRNLQLIDADSDLECELRKMIEYALLVDGSAVLPISGGDLMREFGLPPGVHIGNLLDQAFSLYRLQPRSGGDLLDALREYIPSIKNDLGLADDGS